MTDPTNYHIEYEQEREHGRLVVSTDAVRVTIEGDPGEVRQQFESYHAESLGLTRGPLREVAEEYPMPDPDANLEPVDDPDRR